MARSKAASLTSSFKADIAALGRGVAKKKKELDTLTALYKQTRKQLSKAYKELMELVDRLTDLKVHNTKKESTLREKIKAGRAENVRLTEVRDGYHERIEKVNEELLELGTRLTMLREQEINEIKNIDDIVIQVFDLNEAVVRASTAREDCLKRHVFPRLIDARGNLCSQLAFPSSDGLRRVVAMVNTMTIIKKDLAAEAQREIKHFMERVQKPAKVDPTMEALLELVRQLLIEKTDFKVGPNLYRFISMDLDADIFPELARAQMLLRQSIRSEKTNSYIRIFERSSRAEKWEVVPQS